ncbi:MAG: FmdB family zinc ribbon protein [Candidatus Dormiibacterota bacterium]
MPTYAYRCEAGHQFEAAQGIHDPALTQCVTCGTAVRRVVFPVGIVFKGQGFYKTDSRSSSTSSSSTPATDTKEAPSTTPEPAKTDGVAGTTTAPKPKKDSASESATAAGGA